MGGHFSARAGILAPGRMFVQAGGYFVQNDSKMSKIRLIILYSESYTIIGHFCPKPFVLFIIILWFFDEKCSWHYLKYGGAP